MKNEVLARAMTEIDDELIEAAHAYKPYTVKKNHWRKLYVAAASLLLVFGSARVIQQSHFGIELVLYGDIMKEEPVLVNPMTKGVNEADDVTTNPFVIPLEVKNQDSLKIQAKDGTIEVYSMDTNQMLYRGQDCEVSDSVIIYWSIDHPMMNHSYSIRLNETITVSLSYDERINHWVILKQ